MKNILEEWKQINEYPNYEVSNLGNVRRQTKKGYHLLKPTPNTKGYLRVTLAKNGKAKNFYIHRLVAGAFIPNDSNYPQVNHKDENKQNNNINNLEWCTNRYNTRYSKSKAVFGYDGQSIIEYDVMRDAVKDGFNVGCIWQSINKGYLHKGYRWQYKFIDNEINPLLENIKYRYQTINN